MRMGDEPEHHSSKKCGCDGEEVLRVELEGGLDRRRGIFFRMEELFKS